MQIEKTDRQSYFVELILLAACFQETPPILGHVIRFLMFNGSIVA